MTGVKSLLLPGPGFAVLALDTGDGVRLVISTEEGSGKADLSLHDVARLAGFLIEHEASLLAT